jgi:uncharacterized protein YggE
MRKLKAILVPILIVTVVLSFYHFNQSAQAESEQPKLPVINVSGIGEIAVEPDIAQISLGVVTEDKTAEQAQKDNAVVMNRLLAALADAGIDKKHIQTKNFSVQAQYDYSVDRGNKPLIIGYQVRNTVVVEVKDINTIGNVLDKARDAGVNDVNNIQFMTSKAKQLSTEALALAVADARIQADTIAKALGKTVVDVVSVTTNAGYNPPVAYAKEMMAVARDSSTAIMTGELTISSSVSVQFSMK